MKAWGSMGVVKIEIGEPGGSVRIRSDIERSGQVEGLTIDSRGFTRRSGIGRERGWATGCAKKRNEAEHNQCKLKRE